MQFTFAKVGFAVLLASIALTPAAASAYSPLYRASTPVNILGSGNWNTNGSVSVRGNTVTLTERGNESESAYKDVTVLGHAGDRAVFVAYTKAESVRANDITGLPVLYGYAMNANGKILAYLQGQNMIRTTAKSGAWTVNSGVFTIPAGTTKIRYFMNQAEKQGSAKYGDDAKFSMPGLYIAETARDAARVVSKYNLGLSDVK